MFLDVLNIFLLTTLRFSFFYTNLIDQHCNRDFSFLIEVWNWPGLTSQRHSALISSDSEYFQVCFSAVHYLKISEQRWFSSEQRWNWKFSELKISADLWIIQNDNYWLILQFFKKISKYLNFEAHNSGFSPSLRKEVINKYFLLNFRTGQRYNKYFNFWVYCYCSNNTTDMIQLFKNIFAFIGVKFLDYSKKFESFLSICRSFTFSVIREYHFNDHFVRFQHFGLRYHILIVSSTCVSIRADSE